MTATDDAIEPQGADWHVGLASWIIQDGNYGDFEVGQRAEFAVEFGYEKVLVDAPGPISVRHVEGPRYDVVGRVVATEPDAWVIDVGLLLFSDLAPPAGVAVGSLVAARVYVGVDPFFYFERLATRASFPELIYTWTVEGIGRRVAPFVDLAPRTQARDAGPLTEQPVPRTDAWTQDDGNAEYVLRCRRTGVAPKRSRATPAS